MIERYPNLQLGFEHLNRAHMLLLGSAYDDSPEQGELEAALTSDQIYDDLKYAVEDAARAQNAGNPVDADTQALVVIGYVILNRAQALESFNQELGKYNNQVVQK